MLVILQGPVSKHNKSTECSQLKERVNPKPLTHISQRVHVGIWYILRAQRGSHIPTLRPKYTPYSYMDPLGLSPHEFCSQRSQQLRVERTGI